MADKIWWALFFWGEASEVVIGETVSCSWPLLAQVWWPGSSVLKIQQCGALEGSTKKWELGVGLWYWGSYYGTPACQAHALAFWAIFPSYWMPSCPFSVCQVGKSQSGRQESMTLRGKIRMCCGKVTKKWPSRRHTSSTRLHVTGRPSGPGLIPVPHGPQDHQRWPLAEGGRNPWAPLGVGPDRLTKGKKGPLKAMFFHS